MSWRFQRRLIFWLEQDIITHLTMTLGMAILCGWALAEITRWSAVALLLGLAFQGYSLWKMIRDLKHQKKKLDQDRQLIKKMKHDQGTK